MKTDSLKKIEEIFHDAIERSPADQDAFLASACGDDAELRSEVESLLSFSGPDPSFIDASAAPIAAEMFGRELSPDLTGSTLGRYRIVELLGIGGMGRVYLAEDITLERNVALKVLPASFVADEERMERFLLEARTVSAFNHPNILTIHEIGEADGVRFIATEFIDGVTLRSHAASGQIGYPAFVDISIQIASALEEAHSAGIIHRDIKPDNIMIRLNGLVKVLDFGIAELFDPVADAQPGITPQGAAFGSPNYMSPEQARGERLDPRSDLFSLGSLMYELVSGKKAFPGTGTPEIISAITACEPAHLSELVPGVPHAIERIIARTMAKDIQDRYPSAKEVLADLRAVKLELELDPVRKTNGIGISGSFPFGTHGRFSMTRGWGVLAIVALFVFALAGAFWYRYTAAEDQIRSIAVMPFINETRDSEADYLSDGITENLIRNLSGIPDLSVKARNSVFSYKGRVVSTKQIGSDLSVDAVLYGRLSQRDQSIRLDLELVDTATLDVIWSESYDRSMAELVSLQSGVARDISRKIRPAITGSAQSNVMLTGTVDSEAERLYLKGRFHWNKRTTRNFEKAAEYFRLATENDPGFALAYAGLADTYALMPLYGNFRPNEYKPRAKRSALQALELNPRLAEAHASLGYIVNSFEFDWEAAEREYKIALELDPNYPTARQWYAEHLAFTGRTDEALEQITLALDLDPLSLVINRMKGNVLGFAGRHDEAIEQHWRTIELYPENSLVRFNLGESFAAKGMYKEAVEQFLVGLKMDGKKDYELRRLENAFKLRGWKGFWMQYLAGLINLRKDLLENDKTAYFANEHMALVYAQTGNREMALEFLEKAYVERDPNLMTVRVSNGYDILDADPRYRDLLDKIGLD